MFPAETGRSDELGIVAIVGNTERWRHEQLPCDQRGSHHEKRTVPPRPEQSMRMLALTQFMNSRFMKSTRLAPWTAGALLAAMGLLAGGAALRESVTFDEVAHVGAGVSYWQRLDLRLNEEHPPLAKLIAGLPSVLAGVRADYDHPAWLVSGRFFPAYAGELFFGEMVLKHWNDTGKTLMLARLPMLALTLLLGWIVYLYAREIGGPWGGVLSTAIYATTPLFLGFGPLVHTDVPVAFFALLTLYRAASSWRAPSTRNTVWFGLSLCGALLTKFSGLILLPALTLFVVAMRPGFRSQHLRSLIAGIGISLTGVYIFYLIFSWNQPASVPRWLMPAWLYLRGLFLVALTSSRPAYLLGHSWSTGVWFYFPVLLLLKSAIGFLLLLPIAFFSRIAPGAIVWWRLLWITAAVFTTVLLVSKLDIGFRHFSIPLVLLIVMLAPLPILMGRFGRVFVVACATQCFVAALAAYPFYLTYSNVLGSHRPHYELFNDSNLDWDQSLPEVERFVAARGISSIGLDHFGYTDATASVPQSRIWNCERPSPADAGQWVAVSANMISQLRNCRWLLQGHYEELAGGSMYAAQLPPVIPLMPNPGDYFRTGGGDSRQLFVDFIHDPSVVAKSAAEADRILTQWSAQAPIPKRLAGWLRDGTH